MAESPEGAQSIDGGRSWRLFDWFILPLLSLCNCRRRDANCAQVVNNVAEPIDEQPEYSHLIDCMLNNEIVEAALIYDQPVHGASTDGEIEGVGSSDYSDDESSTYSSSSLTDLSIGSDFEAPIRLRSIDNTDSSSSGQLRLSDLPLLALVTICAHLKRDDLSAESGKDIYNFRNTCRAFAHAVNAFFEKPANLPMIEDIMFMFDNSQISLYAQMSTVSYLMHPLRANRVVFEPELLPPVFRQWVSISAEFDVDNYETIDLAAESLCGPVALTAEVSRFNATSDINKVFMLSRNLIITNIFFTNEIIYKENASHILAYLREHPHLEAVTIACDKFDNLDAPEFLTQFYSATNCITLIIKDWNRRYSRFHDRSNAFWRQFMLQKLHEGARVRYNEELFSECSYFTDVRLWGIELSK